MFFIHPFSLQESYNFWVKQLRFLPYLFYILKQALRFHLRTFCHFHRVFWDSPMVYLFANFIYIASTQGQF